MDMVHIKRRRVCDVYKAKHDTTINHDDLIPESDLPRATVTQQDSSMSDVHTHCFHSQHSVLLTPLSPTPHPHCLANQHEGVVSLSLDTSHDDLPVDEAVDPDVDASSGRQSSRRAIFRLASDSTDRSCSGYASFSMQRESSVHFEIGSSGSCSGFSVSMSGDNPDTSVIQMMSVSSSVETSGTPYTTGWVGISEEEDEANGKEGDTDEALHESKLAAAILVARSSPSNIPTMSTSSSSKRGRRISLSEIGFGKMESYDKLSKLGQGTYASVFKGRSHLTDSLVALKEIHLEKAEGAPCTAIREISILRGLRHANIVTLHDIIHTDRSLTLVFEYLEHDLRQYIDTCHSVLHLDNVRLFLYQLLRGLSFCHKRHILHRDLKPQNILLNDHGDLKLADFGLARSESVPIKTYSSDVASLWYRSPDVLLGATDYSTHIDMWAVGCIFFEMVSGQPSFPGTTHRQQISYIFKLLGSPSNAEWPGIESNPQLTTMKLPHFPKQSLATALPRLEPEGVDLLHQFLKYAPKERVNACDALCHEYFVNHLPWEKLRRLPDACSIFEVEGVALKADPGSLCGAVHAQLDKPESTDDSVLPDHECTTDSNHSHSPASNTPLNTATPGNSPLNAHGNPMEYNHASHVRRQSMLF